MKIIQHSEYVTEIHYQLCYDWTGSTAHHGMAFDCDANGNVNMTELENRPAALANYRECVSGEHKVNAPYVWKLEHSYRVPAVGRCACGCEVELDSFTNTCDGCNRDYNGSGQELAPRSQWGEETGESYCDLQDL